MIRKTVITLAVLLTCSVSFAHGDEEFCDPREDWTCFPGSTFSVDNIHLVHDMLGREGPHYLDGIWHETEPILVDLFDSKTKPSIVGMLSWDSADGPDYGFPTSAKPLECYPSSRNVWDTLHFIRYREGLYVWDHSRQEDQMVLPVSNGEVSRLLVHPDGEWLLAVTENAKLYQIESRLWSATEISLPRADDHALDKVALSSDGRLFAAAGGGTLGVWDTGTWEAWEPKPLVNGETEVIRFAADSTHLLVSYGTAVSRWSLINKSLVYVEQSEPFECFLSFISLTITSDKILTGTTGGSLLVWDLFREKFLFELPVSNGEVTELLTRPSGESVLAVVDKERLYHVDLKR
ncbi:MAG: WD40 repeat domain-containing protein [Chloroflexi bacterium]|nr:WD40 repeat domain-containing protein [Chloroflexota bacterium]